MSNDKWYSIYLDGCFQFAVFKPSAGEALEYGVLSSERIGLSGQVDVYEGDLVETVLASYYIG